VDNSRILENIFKRLLRESVGSDLAALTRRRNGGCLAVLYDANVLRGAFGGEQWESLPTSDLIQEDISASGAVRAYVKIVPPADDCNGAWMIGEMWGRGYGEILVNIAFALSPGGAPLIMDRQIASPGAKSRWRIATRGLKGTPLPPDCTTYHDAPGEEYLNASYESTGNPGELAAMEQLHRAAMDEISEVTNLPPKVIENALMDVAYENFDSSLSDQ